MSLAKIKPWMPHLVALLFVGLGLWYALAHQEDFEVLGDVSLSSLLQVAGTMVASCFLGGWLVNLFLRRFGVRLPWYRWLGLFFVMAAGNIVTPLRGGTGLFAAYLKTEHALPLRRFALMLVGTSMLSALVNSALALVGMGITWWTKDWVNVPLVIVASTILATCISTFFLPNPKPSERRVWKHVVRVLNGWHALLADRGLLWRVLLLSVGQTLTQILGMWFVYRSLGADVTPEALLTIMSLSVMASIVALTPASLGPYDAALLGLPALYGLTAAHRASALVVYRGMSFVTIFALAGVFWLLMRLGTPKAETT
jgi:uncharacterized membrane protein YbhN (UPF0104 family)